MYDPPAPSAGGIPSVPLNPRDAVDAERRASAIPPPTVSSTGPWTMTVFDFSDGPEPAPKPIPEQRADEGAGQAAAPAVEAAPPGAGAKAPGMLRKLLMPQGAAAPAAPGAPGVPGAPAAGAVPTAPGAGGKAGGKRAGRAAAKAAKAAGKGAAPAPAAEGRKPSPLIVLSSLLLVGGAVTGIFPVMLAGWGLGYLSRQLSDLTRKFVILGIPLITMSASTLYAMQQAKQGGAQGGGGLQSGSPLGQISWSSAPNVLRLAAVISAVVLLLLAMRRRPPQQG
ncbi:hypothetical protein ACFQ6N_08785 [Kitasatospora sp. NPDC056446]|uniref:hypothetical protein n=1 Tax=Kitasatospora sp. NPDC056446 TaxID=3345819 RepID=UPI0036A3D1E2